jgi:hypothetical protein
MKIEFALINDKYKKKTKQINLSDELDISFENNILKIGNRISSISHFYGNNIHSLKVIAGENGSGKSRVIKDIIESLIASEQNSVILLLIKQKDEYILFSTININQKELPKIDNKDIELKKFEEMSNYLEDFHIISMSNALELTSYPRGEADYFSNVTTTNLLSGRSLKEYSFSDIRTQIEVLNSTNAEKKKVIDILNANGVTLKNEVQVEFDFYSPDYKEKMKYFNGSFSSLTEIIEREKNEDIISLIHLSNFLKIFKKRDRIIFYPEIMNIIMETREININEISMMCSNLIDKLISIIQENQFYSKDNFGDIKESVEEMRYDYKIFNSFDKFNNSIKDTNLIDLKMYKNDMSDYVDLTDEGVREVNELESYWNNELKSYLMPITSGYLNNILKNPERLNLSKSIRIKWNSISSGEYQIISSICRVYNEITKIDKKNVLIFYDEVDLGFHPMWQKRWIHILTLLLTSFFSKKTFQLVMTTHSPLILSDVLNDDVILFDKDLEEGFVSPGKTFASNIYKLYQDSFFMRDGNIGEFAKYKINGIINELSIEGNNKDFDVNLFNTIISNIGEPLIRNELELLVEQKASKNKLLEYYEKRIEDIKEYR